VECLCKCRLSCSDAAATKINKKQEVNVLGVHNTARSWINSQSEPGKPVGTFINVNSGLAGYLMPGNSAYGSSKLAVHRYMEFLDLGEFSLLNVAELPTTCLTDHSFQEYPTLRTFTILPGIVPSGLSNSDAFVTFAKDEGELSGVLGLYLASIRGNYLKGSLVSVNWDLEEMESHKDEIMGGLLKIKWVPVLPCSGGSGW